LAIINVLSADTQGMSAADQRNVGRFLLSQQPTVNKQLSTITLLRK
jgi:hypothetical protein